MPDEQMTTTGYAPTATASADISRGVPPAEPIRPLRPAPARFGIAGISAGEDRLYKTTVPHDPDRRRKMAGDRLAKGLGWFSLALGTGEILFGRTLARWLGMEGATWLLRAYGVREIATGVGLLSAHRPEDRTPWLWARVGGDTLDLGTLALGLHPSNPCRDRVALAMMAVGGVTALDVACATMTRTSKHIAPTEATYPTQEPVTI